jgi:uncharacterized metal-binding protein YceD (DUF177 family)
MTATQTDAVEFSRPVDLSRLGDATVVQDIEASEGERRALAKRFDLLALDLLRAKVNLRRVQGGTAVRLAGHLSAEVTQSCVVTLDPVANRIEEDFTVLYAPQAAVEAAMVGADADMDLPEPLPEGTLDIGEAVAQQLSLALDPFPRAPGAEIDPEWRGDAEETRENPFARLATFRKNPQTSG